ncbi:hypothetical protein [Thiomicrospira cyclica]|uniref:hypothetical protein n=1 Tax=Thiomicrospira cyclica TaxID=147268 RepID=UPI0002FCFD81|nr:hypothetical protein [Thiomicrospira cyclica]
MLNKLQYWRLAVHLIFKTQHFGVNNQWWSRYPSAIGWTWSQRMIGVLTIMPIVRNYQSLKVRSRIGWMPDAEATALFGKDPHFK